jgi:hypothetical protein
MRTHKKIIVGALACALTLGGSSLAMAGPVGLKITITKQQNAPAPRAWDRNTDRDDEQTYRDWYGAVSRDYSDVDRETGERIGDLLQVVTEVSDTRLMVSDSQRLSRAVFVSKDTVVTFPEVSRRSSLVGFGRPAQRKGRGITDYVKVGDLVVVQGYLRNNGGVFANSIRVYGQARHGNNPPAPSFQGVRLWGTVRSIDGRRGIVDVDTNIGQRRFSLDRNGVVLNGGKPRSFNALRVGDRVVLYAATANDRIIPASRIVVMAAADRYPEVDRPCHTDPNYRAEDNTPADLPGAEGSFVELQPTFLFDRLIVRDRQGNEIVYRVAKETSIVDRKGHEMSLGDVRVGTQLRVQFQQVGDTRFAREVDMI